MAADHPTVPIAAAEVIQYFLNHPQAADTVDGIKGWCLRYRMSAEVDDVDRALAWLAATNLVLVDESSSRAPIFRLNHERLADAKKLIADRDTESRAGRDRRRRE